MDESGTQILHLPPPPSTGYSPAKRIHVSPLFQAPYAEDSDVYTQHPLQPVSGTSPGPPGGRRVDRLQRFGTAPQGWFEEDRAGEERRRKPQTTPRFYVVSRPPKGGGGSGRGGGDGRSGGGGGGEEERRGRRKGGRRRRRRDGGGGGDGLGDRNDVDVAVDAVDAVDVDVAIHAVDAVDAIHAVDDTAYHGDAANHTISDDDDYSSCYSTDAVGTRQTSSQSVRDSYIAAQLEKAKSEIVGLVGEVERLKAAKGKSASTVSLDKMDDLCSSLLATTLTALDDLKTERRDLRKAVRAMDTAVRSGMQQASNAVWDLARAQSAESAASSRNSAAAEKSARQLQTVSHERDEALRVCREQADELSAARGHIAELEALLESARSEMDVAQSRAHSAAVEKIRKVNAARLEDAQALTQAVQKAEAERDALAAKVEAIQKEADARVAAAGRSASASAAAERDNELAVVRKASAKLASKVRQLESAATSSPAIHRELVYARQANVQLRQQQQDLARKLLHTLTQLEQAEAKLSGYEAAGAPLGTRPISAKCACCGHRNLIHRTLVSDHSHSHDDGTLSVDWSGHSDSTAAL